MTTRATAPPLASRSRYPRVLCPAHSGLAAEPGYVVCRHVADKRKSGPIYVELPTEARLGIVTCFDCRNELYSESDFDINKFVLACRRCLVEGGVLTEGAGA